MPVYWSGSLLEVRRAGPRECMDVGIMRVQDACRTDLLPPSRPDPLSEANTVVG